MDSKHDLYGTTKPLPFYISVRFLLAITIFFGTALQYAHKSNISVAIVCMVNHTALQHTTNNSQLEYSLVESISQNEELNKVTCLFANSTEHQDADGKFDWSKTIQEIVLSSYFYGYICSQIPGGYLAHHIGPKIVFLLAMVLGSIGTILVPLCANLHYMALIFCRFLTGFSQGAMYPTIQGMWSKWAPSHEKSILIGLGGSGSQIGSLIGFSLGGYLCRHGGWPSIFYSLGCAGLVWCIFWFFLTADTPEKHKFIKETEKSYIIHHAVSQTNVNEIRQTTPWKAIMTSRACYSQFVSHFSHAWGVILFLTNAPTYMKEVLKFDIKQNGLLLSIPYLSCLLTIIISGYLSDTLIKRFHIEPCKVRKLFNGLGLFVRKGFIIPGGMMIWLSYVSCATPYFGVVLMTLGIAFAGCCNGGGYSIANNEMAGQYSGIVFGISNTIASTTGIFVPYLIAGVTKHKTQAEWRIVFFVTAGVYFLGAISSICFGSAKLEPWAVKPNKKSEETQIN